MKNIKAILFYFLLLLAIMSTVLARVANSNVLADGVSINELISGASEFEFQFQIDEEAAKGAYELTGPLKMAAKAQGGMNLPYGLTIELVDNTGCSEDEPFFQKSDQLKSNGWKSMVKNGESANVKIEADDLYDKLNYKLGKCEMSGAALELKVKLITIHKSKMKMGGGSATPDHVLSEITLPVSASAVSAMLKGADEKTYQEFVSGNKAHKVRDDALMDAIHEELNRVKKPSDQITTIHIQNISYQNVSNTVLRWYAHNIYKNGEGKCKFGYIYGEATKLSNGGYSMNYLNGEREEFIACEYAEKLRNR